jgi:carbamoyltransferase
LPDNYYDLLPMQRLYVPRSDVPAITHIDFSARIQSVHKDRNEKFWKLIDRFKAKTGYGIIVNTSFNVRGEPIVCAPEDAYRCFMRTEMDYLVMNSYLYEKSAQPQWDKKDNWQNTFKLD